MTKRWRVVAAGLLSISLSLVLIDPGNSYGAEEMFQARPCPKLAPPLPALEKARCGVLVVPENRLKSDGNTFRLNVAIIPSKAVPPAPDPVVYMVGGPGGPALPSAQLLVDHGLNAKRDLIIMDQRGTLFSAPALLCPEVDRFRARFVGLTYDAPSSGLLHVEATLACRGRLAATGVDLGAFNSTQSAADFADLRSALGIEAWNVYGVSYGTDLAMTYLRAHPEGVRSVAIDSVLPPSIQLGDFWPSLQAGLQAIFDQCEAQEACRKRYPNTAATFKRLVNQLETHPISGDVIPALPGVPPPPVAKPVHVVVDGGAFANLAAGMSEFLPTHLPALMDDLDHGVTHEVLSIYAAAGVTHEGELSFGLHNGVICSEWVPYESPDNIVNQGRSVFPNLPASVLALPPQFPFMREDCAVWNVPKGPASQREVSKEPIPTLVISGSYDAMTAPLLARRVVDQLTKPTFVIIPGVGHFVVPKSKCAQTILDSFFTDPSAPDTSCVGNVKPPEFYIARR